MPTDWRTVFGNDAWDAAAREARQTGTLVTPARLMSFLDALVESGALSVGASTSWWGTEHTRFVTPWRPVGGVMGPEFDDAVQFVAREGYDRYIADNLRVLLTYPRLPELLHEAGWTATLLRSLGIVEVTT
jgi:hypothetical protein